MRSPSFKAPLFSCYQHPLLMILLAIAAFYMAWVGQPGPARATAANHRIVSLAPALTEMLYALELGPQVVGVSAYSDFPADAKTKPVVGDATHVNEERVLSLSPDMIVAAEGDAASLARLGKLTGARTLLLPTHHVTEIWANMRTLGAATGRSAKALAVTTRLAAQVQAIAARAPHTHPAVFYMVWDQPLMTAGHDSYLNDLIALAGGRNVTDNVAGAYPSYSWEGLLAANPDVLLAPWTLKPRLEAAGRHYPSLKAVKLHHLRTLPDDVISRPGPRVVEALQAVERALK